MSTKDKIKEFADGKPVVALACGPDSPKEEKLGRKTLGERILNTLAKPIERYEKGDHSPSAYLLSKTAKVAAIGMWLSDVIRSGGFEKGNERWEARNEKSLKREALNKKLAEKSR